MPPSYSPRWCRPRSRPSDGSSKPPKAGATWQIPGKRAGVSHSSVHLPPDFLSHPAGHLHAPDGQHDGGRWPHRTRGESPCNLHNMLSACVTPVQPFYQSVNEFLLSDGKSESPFPLLPGIHTRRSPQRCEPSSGCLPQCQQCFSLR